MVEPSNKTRLQKTPTVSTYTKIIYQLVFGTKYRQPTLHPDWRQQLFAYQTGILQKKKCHVYKINGVADHEHLVFSLHPSVALANLVKDVKLASNKFIQTELNLPDWAGWQKGYGAFTYTNDALDNLIRYVKNQEEHHRKRTFKEEFELLLQRHQVDYEEAWLFED